MGENLQNEAWNLPPRLSLKREDATVGRMLLRSDRVTLSDATACPEAESETQEFSQGIGDKSQPIEKRAPRIVARPSFYPGTMILSIFFARFLSEQGTRVVHQSPPGCIVSEQDVGKGPGRLFDWETMAEYVIPRQAFCNRYVTICDPDNRFRLLGHPVCIKDEKYLRNEFIFNFCIVVDISIPLDKIPYEGVVRRLAAFFTEMEIQNQYLSQEVVSEDRRSIAALLEIIKEDMNNYNECMIPVDDANTINMKLFPTHEYPPPVKSWHVPVSKTDFASVIDDTWDLTMKKVIKELDGINSVRHIAHKADVAIDLAKVALQHLLFYDTILMLDTFLFGNIYAPGPDLNDFISDIDGLQEECAAYVYVNGPRLDNFYLVRLFTSLCVSRTVKEWLKLHMDQGFNVMNYVDVRRLIQFGLIKGLIVRVHKYAVSAQMMAHLAHGKEIKSHGGDILQSYADGTQCFDQITAEKNVGDVKIMDLLKKFPRGDVEIIYR